MFRTENFLLNQIFLVRGHLKRLHFFTDFHVMKNNISVGILTGGIITKKSSAYSVQALMIATRVQMELNQSTAMQIKVFHQIATHPLLQSKKPFSFLHLVGTH